MKRWLNLIPVLLLFAATAQAATPAGWHSYHDALGFTVSFPGDWKADPDSYQVDFNPDGDPAPRTRTLIVVPTKDIDPGSTLDSGSVSISILPLPRFRSSCAARNFMALSSPDSSEDLDVDTARYAHAAGDDPGGWYTNEDYVWRVSSHPCVGVQYTFSYHTDDSEQARTEKPFNRARLLKLLNAIRATVVLDPAH